MTGAKWLDLHDPLSDGLGKPLGDSIRSPKVECEEDAHSHVDHELFNP